MLGSSKLCLTSCLDSKRFLFGLRLSNEARRVVQRKLQIGKCYSDETLCLSNQATLAHFRWAHANTPLSAPEDPMRDWLASIHHEASHCIFVIAGASSRLGVPRSGVPKLLVRLRHDSSGLCVRCAR